MENDQEKAKVPLWILGPPFLNEHHEDVTPVLGHCPFIFCFCAQKAGFNWTKIQGAGNLISDRFRVFRKCPFMG